MNKSNQCISVTQNSELQLILTFIGVSSPAGGLPQQIEKIGALGFKILTLNLDKSQLFEKITISEGSQFILTPERKRGLHILSLFYYKKESEIGKEQRDLYDHLVKQLSTPDHLTCNFLDLLRIDLLLYLGSFKKGEKIESIQITVVDAQRVVTTVDGDVGEAIYELVNHGFLHLAAYLKTGIESEWEMARELLSAGYKLFDRLPNMLKTERQKLELKNLFKLLLSAIEEGRSTLFPVFLLFSFNLPQPSALTVQQWLTKLQQHSIIAVKFTVRQLNSEVKKLLVGVTREAKQQGFDKEIFKSAVYKLEGLLEGFKEGEFCFSDKGTTLREICQIETSEAQTRFTTVYKLFEQFTASYFGIINGINEQLSLLRRVSSISVQANILTFTMYNTLSQQALWLGKSAAEIKDRAAFNQQAQNVIEEMLSLMPKQVQGNSLGHSQVALELLYMQILSLGSDLHSVLHPLNLWPLLYPFMSALGELAHIYKKPKGEWNNPSFARVNVEDVEVVERLLTKIDQKNAIPQVKQLIIIARGLITLSMRPVQNSKHHPFMLLTDPLPLVEKFKGGLPPYPQFLYATLLKFFSVEDPLPKEDFLKFKTKSSFLRTLLDHTIDSYHSDYRVSLIKVREVLPKKITTLTEFYLAYLIMENFSLKMEAALARLAMMAEEPGDPDFNDDISTYVMLARRSLIGGLSFPLGCAWDWISEESVVMKLFLEKPRRFPMNQPIKVMGNPEEEDEIIKENAPLTDLHRREEDEVNGYSLLGGRISCALKLFIDGGKFNGESLQCVENIVAYLAQLSDLVASEWPSELYYPMIQKFSLTNALMLEQTLKLRILQSEKGKSLLKERELLSSHSLLALGKLYTEIYPSGFAPLKIPGAEKSIAAFSDLILGSRKLFKGSIGRSAQGLEELLSYLELQEKLRENKLTLLEEEYCSTTFGKNRQQWQQRISKEIEWLTTELRRSGNELFRITAGLLRELIGKELDEVDLLKSKGQPSVLSKRTEYIQECLTKQALECEKAKHVISKLLGNKKEDSTGTLLLENVGTHLLVLRSIVMAPNKLQLRFSTALSGVYLATISYIMENLALYVVHLENPQLLNEEWITQTSRRLYAHSHRIDHFMANMLPQKSEESKQLIKEMSSFLTFLYHYPAMKCDSEWKNTLALISAPECDKQMILDEGIFSQGDKVFSLIDLLFERIFHPDFTIIDRNKKVTINF